jgi:hypothetical protein
LRSDGKKVKQPQKPNNPILSGKCRLVNDLEIIFTSSNDEDDGMNGWMDGEKTRSTEHTNRRSRVLLLLMFNFSTFFILSIEILIRSAHSP